MTEISPEDMKNIAEQVRKKMVEALLLDPASSAARGTCFRCGRLGTYRCEDDFECTTTFRCGSGFIRVIEPIQQ